MVFQVMSCHRCRGFPLMWPCDDPCSASLILCVSGWLQSIKGGSYVVVWIGLLWYYSPGWHPVWLEDVSREELIGWRASGSFDYLCGVTFIVSFGMCGIVCLSVACPGRVWSSTYMITLLRMRGPLVDVGSLHRGCSAWIGRVVWSCWCVCSHCCRKKGVRGRDFAIMR